jgi:TDG/mug DNA glycosylase family protein
MRSRGFPPVAGRDARVLVLGTLPGPVSLKAGQYYAQSRNAFWPIMGELFGASRELPYPRRLAALRKHRVALWDVCASAHRPGALDASIDRSSMVPNNFRAFLAAHRGIRRVFFNGRTAAELYRRYVLPGLPEALASIPSLILPSTSPAHAAMPYEAKLARWRQLESFVGDQSPTRASRARHAAGPGPSRGTR